MMKMTSFVTAVVHRYLDSFTSIKPVEEKLVLASICKASTTDSKVFHQSEVRHLVVDNFVHETVCNTITHLQLTVV